MATVGGNPAAAAAGDNNNNGVGGGGDDGDADELEAPACPICFEMYEAPPSERAPVNLPCGHCVCHADAVNLQEQGDPTEVICPVCRDSSTHPDGPANLPINYGLVAACEVIQAQQRKHARQSGGGGGGGGGGGAPQTQVCNSACEQCDEGTHATHFCEPCGEFLCPMCLAMHSRQRSSKAHEVLTMAALTARGGVDAARRSSGAPALEMCEDHPGGGAKRLWCETCSVMICRDCIVVDHRFVRAWRACVACVRACVCVYARVCVSAKSDVRVQGAY